MDTRGRSRRLGRRQDSKDSRDSSVSSSSREVRCGCQYFQSDSLLPERHSLVGTRPASRNMGDHEYEPISHPASQPAQPPLLMVTDQEGQEKITEPERIDLTPIINDSKHQFLRIPLDKDIVIPMDKAEIESLRYDDEDEVEKEVERRDGQEIVMEEMITPEMTAQEIQDQIEERFFAATPSTTVSRTDGEFNTSQMDSSGLDELPLKRDARRGFNAKGFQQRVQSQAGRLRTRIRNISRPKFNLPDRSKLHLPERPKFNFPERPKFNLPDRPKFNIKRPDLKMPNFSFGKTKTSSIRRPLRDRSQIPSNQSTVGSKKNIFDSIKFRTYPRIFSKKNKAAQGRRALTPPPRMETESTHTSSPVSRTGPINERWTHKFKDIKFADSSDNQSDLKKPSFDDDIEDDSAAFREPDFKTVVLLTDTKQNKAASSSSIPGSDREQHSSGSSSERHRAGVIEEIDSDEFFVREKGLSREDIDVSRYLSLEIRDAFRSPKNALASLDKEAYDDNVEGYELRPHRPTGEPIRLSMEAIRNQSLEQIRMTPERDMEYSREEEEEVMEPVRPERTRSLKKRSTRSRSEEPRPDQENQFNTYPPNRPTRNRKDRSQSKQSIPPDEYNEEKRENQEEKSMITKRPPSVPSLAITDTTKELSPTRYIDESSEALDEPWVDEPQPPLPPKRRKSTRDSSQDNESPSAHQIHQERWLDDEQIEDIVLNNETALQRGRDHRPVQNGYYDTPPPLPVRKSRSRGTSLADEDRTSRGADSLISETRTHMTEDFPVDNKHEIKAFIEDCDYAFVDKTVIEVKPKPATAEKPIHPPAPSRKKKTVAQLTALKNHGIHFFYTYPRRAIKKSLHRQPQAPIRPIRNYSSIGPARPPRKNRVFREPVYEGEFIPLRDENDTAFKDEYKTEYIDDENIDSIISELDIDEKSSKRIIEQEDTQDIRDLQSGDIIEKMKGRPLPPPPRPPRKTKDDQLDDEDRDLDLDIEVTDLDDEDEVVVERIDILVGNPRHDEDRKEKSNSAGLEDLKLIEGFCEWKQEIEESTQEPIHKPLIKSSYKELSAEPQNKAEQQGSQKEPPVKLERRKKSLSVARRAATPVTLVEATVSTQTDLLPEGFYVEEEQQTMGDYSKSEETPTKTSQTEKKVETIIEHKVVVIPTPETEILKAKKIHVSELEVEKLNVAELQAQKITVSDIDGVTMQVTELTSKSGHLVISGFELPSSFLEAITPPPPPAPIIQIQSSTQTPPETMDSQTNTTPQEEIPPRTVFKSPTSQEVHISTEATPRVSTESKPAPEEETIFKQTAQEQMSQPLPTPIPTPPLQQKRPSPPPAIVIQTPQGQSSPAYVPGYVPSSPPPRSPTRTRALGHDSEEELRLIPRRRRHHSHKHSPQYSSDEEDEEEFPSYHVPRKTHQREQTSSELVRQLLNIWQASFVRGVNQVVDGLNSAFPEGEKRKDAQTAACIIIVLIAGLIMLGFGSDRTVHHHHWDFLPPHP